MDKSAYHLWDLHRILFGNAPAEFLIEILFRTAVTYFFLLVIVAWLGKRMSGKVTITELAVVIMLGAIVAPPMETPERGIVQGVVILTLVLFMHRTVTSISLYPKAQKIIQGRLDICIKDGVVDIGVIRRIRISRAQLFSVLRLNRVYNLGQVERLYIEANGKFSIFLAEHHRPGLSVLPDGDKQVHDIQQHPDPSLQACTSCGTTVDPARAKQPCPHCGNTSWDNAVL